MRLDHIRREAGAKIIDLAEKREANQKPARYKVPRDGDLVLLRRFLLDQRKGSKLEARWEGPYILSDLAKDGKTGRLRDLNTREIVRVKKGALRDRVHLNDLKVYLRRGSERQAGVELVNILEYERRATGEGQANVVSLEGTGTGGSRGLEWRESEWLGEGSDTTVHG